MGFGEETVNLQVPLLHDSPQLGSLELTYEVWSEGATGLPILFLCGGPGERATDLRRHLPWGELARQRPIILLNQRGTDLVPGPLALDPEMFTNPEAALGVLSRQAPKVDARAFTPWQSAMDIALLADALGVDQIDILAHSYGTHLTMAAMKTIPERLGKIALLGFEGPNQTFKFSQPFDAALARSPHGPELLASLESREWEVEVDQALLRMGKFGIRWMLASWMGLEARMKRLPALLSDPRENLPKAVNGFIGMLRRRSPIYYLNDAASSASADRWARLAAEKSDWGTSINFPFPQIGEAYGVSALPDAFRSDPVFDGDVLVLTGEYDAFTPTSNFIEAGKGLTGATHRELPGAYHDTLLLGSESADVVLSWFEVPNLS